MGRVEGSEFWDIVAEPLDVDQITVGDGIYVETTRNGQVVYRGAKICTHITVDEVTGNRQLTIRDARHGEITEPIKFTILTGNTPLEAEHDSHQD